MKRRVNKGSRGAVQSSQTASDAGEGGVIALLRHVGRPLSFEELLAQSTAEHPIDAVKLRAEVEALIRSGAILRNRRDELCLRERLPLIVGTISGHRDGYGFLLPDDRSAPVYLSNRQMSVVMHGDRAAVRISGKDSRGRPEGSIVDILERTTQEIVGRLYEESGISFVVPDNPRITHRVLVPQANLNGARPGQVVLIKLLEAPSRTAQPIGAVTRLLGEHAAPGMETEIAIHSHGLPFEFPEAAIAQAERHGKDVDTAAKQQREDLRDLPLVTIDGEDARDFDDAVWAERTSGGGWRLIVAIADVAHYVPKDSALDEEAQNRATSVYFPNRVVPMLPEALSNGLCSLNPAVDRLCIACEMRVSKQGKITRSRFFEGVMRSAARLTYTKVADFLGLRNAPSQITDAAVAQSVTTLHEVYKALHAARVRRGALDFDAPEVKVLFDEQGKIAALVEQDRNDAHRLIEECMVAANVEAARFLKKHKIPTLYRVHGQPEADRLEQLRQFLAGFNIKLPAGDDIVPADLANVLQEAAKREEVRLIETVVIRSMAQAVYQSANIGHFGLAVSEYVHFTSPIRRYPDLLVHRGLRHVLRGGSVEDFGYSEPAVAALGQQCSFKERRADEATRSAISWLKCEFMQDRIGEEFDTVVSGVTDFGLFVQIKGMQIDGLIHVSALGHDYFSRDKSGYRMVGERSGRIFRLGDHLRVRLINVIIDERKIDFELAETKSQPQHARNPWRRRSKQR